MPKHIKEKPTCKKCGTDNIVFDSTATWDVEKQDYIHAETFDHVWCQECGYDGNYAEWVAIK